MIERFRHAPWASILLFLATVVVPTFGSLWLGHVILTWWVSAAPIDVPTDVTYLLGWLFGANGVLIGYQVINHDRVRNWCEPGYIYLETVEWPLHGEDEENS
jgi:hypothetical protein